MIRSSYGHWFWAIVVVGLLIVSPCEAVIRLSSFYTDGMVLQRNKPIKIKGLADAGEVVSILWQNCTVVAHPDAKGRWEATLAPTPAGGPYSLEFFGKEALKIRNVYVGELVVVAGDEYMHQSVETAGLIEVLERVPDALLRICQVNRLEASFPQANVSQSQIWASANEFNVLDKSAIGIWYATEIRRYAQIPVGLVQATWPGTALESWMSPESAMGIEELKLRTEELRRMGQDPGDFAAAKRIERRNRYEAYLAHQVSLGKPIYTPKAWLKRHELTHDWQTVYLPGDVRQHPRFANHPLVKGNTGVYYVSRRLVLPKMLRNQSQYVLSLGSLQSLDSVWVNGQLIGTLPANWKGHRQYTYNAPLRTDTLSILIRWEHEDNLPLGYESTTSDFVLKTPNGNFLLGGGWYLMQALDYQSTYCPPKVHQPRDPATVYNAMIAPLTSLTIGHVLWGQGSANENRGWQYGYLFPAFIEGWRKAWGGTPIPFLFAQMPRKNKPRYVDAPSALAELRASQSGVLTMAQTGMACAIDAGDSSSQCKANPLLVANRLFLQYRKRVLDERLLAEGPSLSGKPVVKEAVLTLAFDEGLTASGEVLAFALAGADGKFYPAMARLDGKKVHLTSASVPTPVWVRYAWADYPIGNGVYGKSSGLPLAPFRTDALPLSSYLRTKDLR